MSAFVPCPVVSISRIRQSYDSAQTKQESCVFQGRTSIPCVSNAVIDNEPEISHALSRLEEPVVKKKAGVVLYDLTNQGPTDYLQVLDFQKTLVRQTLENQQRIQSNIQEKNKPKWIHSLVLVEHEHVYTLGTGSTTNNVLFDIENPPRGSKLYRTERGGEVTYHGPGQLVIYPIFSLSDQNSAFQKDLHWYIGSLEQVVINVVHKLNQRCARVASETSKQPKIKADRKKGMIGVWVDDEKVAAIGVKVTKWITYHGIGLNVSTELGMFDYIVPCGIQEYGVTSLKRLFDEHENSWPGTPGIPSMSISLVKDLILESFSEIFSIYYLDPCPK